VIKSDSDALNYIFVLAEMLKRSFDVRFHDLDDLTLAVTDRAGNRVDVLLARRPPASTYHICLAWHKAGPLYSEPINIDAAGGNMPDVISVIEEYLAKG
jgi:hypothetical protein